MGVPEPNSTAKSPQVVPGEPVPLEKSSDKTEFAEPWKHKPKKTCRFTLPTKTEPGLSSWDGRTDESDTQPPLAPVPAKKVTKRKQRKSKTGKTCKAKGKKSKGAKTKTISKKRSSK